MKAVLISIAPKWCEKIASDEKTIEVRKTRPSILTPFKAYIYCTKEKPFIQKIRFGDIAISHTQISKNLYNGKVIGEFVCDKVTPLVPLGLRGFEVLDETLKAMCLTTDDLNVYGGLKTLYAWHISDLKIYDTPKELNEFRVPCRTSCKNCKNPLYYNGRCEEDNVKILTRPPQSWCYVQ